jgi:hypothetical protein
VDKYVDGPLANGEPLKNKNSKIKFIRGNPSVKSEEVNQKLAVYFRSYSRIK